MMLLGENIRKIIFQSYPDSPLTLKLTFRNTRAKGNCGEKLAIQHLLKQGLTLVGQNITSPYGELDALMRDGEEWVFVEVRYRKSQHFGGGLESVDTRKQKKLIKTAEHYMQTHHKTHFDACRFDIIEMSGALDAPEINWIQNAFDASARY